ncbi:hypothetical protein NDU88_008286 [Pleurodeles waltl]|uniref:Uncharacterized protein n=1 Tax=Pleurodeles waltl TaxID=8319 RepID=A0AAV7RUV4_PLEWA|nr:hypothetical protein NDU88_008286 [Pleurodeles waltl]
MWTGRVRAGRGQFEPLLMFFPELEADERLAERAGCLLLRPRSNQQIAGDTLYRKDSAFHPRDVGKISAFDVTA